MKRQLKKVFSIICIISIIFSILNVNAGIKKTKLNKRHISIQVGSSYTITLKNKNKKAIYRFKSSNKKIAAVNKKGKVRAKKKGSARITVYQKLNNRTKKIGRLKVTVKAKKNNNKPSFKNPKEITPPKATPTIMPGTKPTLMPTVSPETILPTLNNPIKTNNDWIIYDISGTESNFTKKYFNWSFDREVSNLPISVEYHTLTPNKTLLSGAEIKENSVEFVPVGGKDTGIAYLTIHVGNYQKTVFVKVYDLSLRLVAIDCDDGPSAFTGQILDTLNNAGVSATFFVTGKSFHDITNEYIGAEVYPEILKQEVAWGHQIGNHTYEHPWQDSQNGSFPEGQTKSWRSYTSEEEKAQVTRLDDLIFNLVGFVPKYYSAPYGTLIDYNNFNQKSFINFTSFHSTDDYITSTTKEQITEKILSTPNNGIILTHDAYQKTADAIKEALNSPRAKEIQFVTIAELDEILKYRR